MLESTCPYCGRETTQVTGKTLYPHRPDLFQRKFWACLPCDAYVGCHPNGEPLGRLANKQLRAAKQKAHYYFDPIWRDGKMKRTKAYKWLSQQLGIKVEDCHIGHFDIKLCDQVVAICQRARFMNGG